MRSLSHHLGAGYFIRPLPLAAVAILVLNDRYLKFAYPSWVTGKLSDVAGLFFFPLFLCALVCLALNLATRTNEDIYWINRPLMIGMIVLTGLIFSLVKMCPQVTWAYVQTLGFLGFPSKVTYDPSDLLALLVLPLTYLYGSRFIESR